MDKPINCLIYIELFCFRQRKDMIHSWVMENTGFWQPYIKLNEAIIMDDSELFKLKLSREEHVSVLKTALKLSTFSDPDICLLSRGGFKVYTHWWCKNTIDANLCLTLYCFPPGPCYAFTALCWAACCVKLVTAAAVPRLASQSLQQLQVFTLSYSCCKRDLPGSGNRRWKKS